MEDKMEDKLSYLLDYADSIHLTGNSGGPPTSDSFHSSDSLQHYPLNQLTHSSSSTEKQQQQLKYEMRKFESLVKADFETLQKKYAELWTSYSASQNEIVKLNKSLETLLSERNSVVKEKDGLRQQCSAAILQWDKAMRENNETKEQLTKVQQQRDDALKKINQEMALRIKAAKDLSRLTEERNAAFQEYNLIMSERDSVHKEIERLSEELSELQKKCKQVEAEKRSLLDELESIKKDAMYSITVAGDGDQFHSKTGGINGASYGTQRWGSSSSGIASSWMMHNYSKGAGKDAPIAFRHKPLSASNSSSVSSCGRPMISGKATLYAKITEQLDNEDQTTAYPKQLDALQQECIELSNELDMYKQQRDQAINDKEKANQERESIRLLSDNLRRERDRAIRDLAEALRDLDDTKRQKCETMMELCESFKDRLSDQNNSENENKENQEKVVESGGTESGPPAVQYEPLEVKLINKFKGFSHPPNWGIQVSARNKQIVVQSVDRDGPAVNLLQPMDIIVKINSIPVDSEPFCRRLLSECFGEVRITLRRLKNVFNSCIELKDAISCGMQIEKLCVIRHLRSDRNSHTMTKASSSRASGRSTSLSVGDILLQVNGSDVGDTFNFDQAISQCGNQVCLQLFRGSIREYLQLDRIEAPINRSILNPNAALELNYKDMSPVLPPGHQSSKKMTAKRSKENNFEELHQHFGEIEKPSSSILDRAYHRLFGKSNKAKQIDKCKDGDKIPNRSFDVKETLDAFNQVLDDFTGKKEPIKKKSQQNSATKSRKDKNDNGGTWPKYRPSTASAAFPTYNNNTHNYQLHTMANGKVNGFAATMYHPIKRKERKSLSIFTSLTRPKESGKDYHHMHHHHHNHHLHHSPTVIEMASSVPRHHHSATFKRDSAHAQHLLHPLHVGHPDDGEMAFHRYQDHRLEDLYKNRNEYKLFPDTYSRYSQHSPDRSKPMVGPSPHDASMSSSFSSHTSALLKEPTLQSAIVKSYRMSDITYDHHPTHRKYEVDATTVSAPLELASSSSSSSYRFSNKKSTFRRPFDVNRSINSNAINSMRYESLHEPTSPTANDFFDRFSTNEALIKTKFARTCPERSPGLRQSSSSSSPPPLPYTLYTSGNEDSDIHRPLGLSSDASIRNHFSRPCSSVTSHHSENNYTVSGLTAARTAYTSSPQSPKLKTFAPIPQKSSSNENDHIQHLNHHDLNAPDSRYPITPSPSSSLYSGEALGSSPGRQMDTHGQIGRTVAHHHSHLHNRHSPLPKNSSSYNNDNGAQMVSMMAAARHHTQRSNPTTSGPFDPVMSSYAHYDALGTLPKRNQRIRISSNNSVNSKVSNCSIDKHLPDHLDHAFASLPVASLISTTTTINSTTSPTSTTTGEQAHILYQIEWLNRSGVACSIGLNDSSAGNQSALNAPQSGDIRSIQIEKANEPLGIQISNFAFDRHGPCPGIFISTVSPQSLAARVGLQVGDQLLEICGINMRSANYDAAANVLRQCGNMLNIKVQFNPEKYATLQAESSNVAADFDSVPLQNDLVRSKSPQITQITLPAIPVPITSAVDHQRRSPVADLPHNTMSQPGSLEEAFQHEDDSDHSTWVRSSNLHSSPDLKKSKEDDSLADNYLYF